MISKGNHVKFARCVLLAVSEEAETWLSFFFFQCIIKQLLGSVFVIFRIIKVSSAVTSLSLRLQLITPTSTLIILDITKTASNNSRFPNEKHKKRCMYMTSNTTSYGISFYRYKCTQKLECVWKNFRMYCGVNVPLIWFTNSLKLAPVTALRLVHTTLEEF